MKRVLAAVTVILAVHGAAGAATRPANDDLEQASVVSVPSRVSGTTVGSTRQDGEPSCNEILGGTVWHRFTAPPLTPWTSAEGLVPMVISLDTAWSEGTTWSGSIAVYQGDTVDSLDPIDCRSSSTNRTTLWANPEETYLVQVGGASATSAGDFTLTLAIGVRSAATLYDDGEHLTVGAGACVPHPLGYVLICVGTGEWTVPRP